MAEKTPLYEIRRAVEADAAAIAEVMIASRRKALPDLREVHTPDQVRQWIAASVLTECDVWVAEVQSRVIGFLALSTNSLEHLYIHPQYWSQGIGGQFMAIAKEKSSRLRLYTFQKNQRAQDFYVHHGFLRIGLGDGSGNEEREPDALYEWRRPGQP